MVMRKARRTSMRPRERRVEVKSFMLHFTIFSHLDNIIFFAEDDEGEGEEEGGEEEEDDA